MKPAIDWRGLAQLVGVPAETMPALSASADPTSIIISLLNQDDINIANLKMLLLNFERLDRYDVADDLIVHFETDARHYMNNIPAENPGSSPYLSQPFASDNNILTRGDVHLLQEGLGKFQYYDAYVLHADEDLNFAVEVVKRMEPDLKLCLKNRDLLAGQENYSVIQRLIAERCAKVIVILSPAFVLSTANAFLVSFAQAVGIEMQQRKIIPCLYQSCEVPQLLLHYSKLSFIRQDPFFDVWARLRDSIKTPTTAIKASPRLRIRESESSALSTNGYKSTRLALPELMIQSYHSTSSLHIDQVSVPSFYKAPVNNSTVEPQMINTTTMSLPSYFPPISHSLSETNLKNDNILLNTNIHTVNINNESCIMPDSIGDGSLPSFKNLSINNDSLKKKKWYRKFPKFNTSSKKHMPVIAD